MTLQYSPAFLRQYKKVPLFVKHAMEQKELLFKSNPFHSFLKTHKLKGDFSGYWSFSVTRDYRIIFSFDENALITFHAIGSHDDIY